MTIAGFRFGTTVGVVLLVGGLLAGCAAQTDPNPRATVTGRASTMSTPDVDAGVKGDLGSNKTAVNAYIAAKNGQVPTTTNLTTLTQYGATQGAGTKNLMITPGTAANAGKFCLTATGASGKTYVVTSNTEVAQAAACPGGTW